MKMDDIGPAAVAALVGPVVGCMAFVCSVLLLAIFCALNWARDYQ